MSNVLTQAYALAHNDDQESVSILMMKMHALLRQGQLSVCREILRKADFAQLNTGQILALLSVASNFEEMDDATADYLARVRKHLRKEYPKEYWELLEGYL